MKMKIGRDPAMISSACGSPVRRSAPIASCTSMRTAPTGESRHCVAEEFAEFGVSWFEEPVSSDDLEGLRLIRDRAPVGMEIAAGEYGFTSWYFARMLQAGAVDCLQADCTRCQGITGFLQADPLCPGPLCTAFGPLWAGGSRPSVLCGDPDSPSGVFRRPRSRRVAAL